MFCYLGSKIFEAPHSELGKYLGISTSAVWRAVREGKRVIGAREVVGLGSLIVSGPKGPIIF